MKYKKAYVFLFIVLLLMLIKTKVYAAETEHIYATLYTDGTLVFSSTEELLQNKTVKKSYGDIYNYHNRIDGQDYPWKADYENIFYIDIVDKIIPQEIIKKCNENGEEYKVSCFSGLKNLKKINNLDNLDVSNVTDMEGMFLGCFNLTELDLSNFNTQNVTDMSSMFEYCAKITELDLSNFNTKKVTDMNKMFTNCEKLEKINVNSLDTRNVKNVSQMFCMCRSLTQIDVSNFDTRNLTETESFWGMFAECSNLKIINISCFDINKNQEGLEKIHFLIAGSNNLEKIIGNGWELDKNELEQKKEQKSESISSENKLDNQIIIALGIGSALIIVGIVVCVIIIKNKVL